MSERSKGDVSSRVNNNANRVVKNPLLSASVTGLSYDDFPNKPLLLPAAPPVVHAPPPQPTNTLIAGILNREHKTLVTVGQSSSIDDNETLDEINLNTSGSDDSVAVNSSLNLFQSSADPNANPLLEPPAADSLLSQAASSFGALPSVASNVFSSFSKRIYAGSRETEDTQQPQLDIQPTYIQQAGQATFTAAPFYAAPPPAVGEVAPEPPKFYAPTELPSLGAAAGPSLPPPSAGQNTYRITARKKLYAPIPGFTEQQQQPAAPIAASFQTPPYPAQPAQPAVAVFEPPIPQHVQEERKPTGGLFSLTSLVPTGVLQNISGLVQSATGRANEPAAPVSYNAPISAPGSYFDISTSSAGAHTQQTANYFAPAPIAVAPSAANSNFLPTGAPSTVEGFFNPLTAVTAPDVVPPPPVGGYFTPASAAQPLEVVPTLSVVQPPLFGQPPAVPSSVAQPLLVTQQPPIAQFPPVASAQPPSVAFAQPPIFGQPPTVAQLPTVAQPPFENTSLPGPPPVASSAALPPTAGTAQASYRLQKGTRLYKSPLTAQETATQTTTFGQPSAFPAAPFANPTAAPAAIFNPFGAAVSESVALFAPTAPSVSPAPSNASYSQEVQPTAITTGLFTPQAFAEVPPTSTPLFSPVSALASNIQESSFIPQSAAPAPTLYPSAALTTSYFTPQTNTASNLQSEPPQAALFGVPATDSSSLGVNLFPDVTANTAASVPLYPPGVGTNIFAPPQITELTTEQSENSSLFATKEESNQDVNLFAATEAVQGFSQHPPEKTLLTAHTHEIIQPASQVELTPKVQILESTKELSNLEATQEVPLFAAPPTAVQSNLFTIPTTEATQEVSVLESAKENPKFEPAQEVPLFAAPPTAVQGNLFTIPTSEATQEVSILENSKLEPTQEVPLFAAPPGNLFTSPTTEATQDTFLQAPASATSFFTPTLEPSPVNLFALPEQEANQFSSLTTETAQELNLYPPVGTAPAVINQEIPLFVPVPTTETNQGVVPYPATNHFAPGSQNTTDLGATVDAPIEAAATAQAPPSSFASSSLFATTTASSASTTAAPALETSSFFAPSSAALTTQTTTTFFNPFAQTITTPLPQDLLPPPVGFVAPTAEANVLFEAQTIEPVLPETTLAPPPPTAAAVAPPPKQTDTTAQTANPFRRSNEAVAQAPAAAAPLLNFFTPVAQSADFNLFAAQQQLPPQADLPPTSDNATNFFAAAQQKTQPTPQPLTGLFPELPPKLSISPPALALEPPPAAAAADVSSNQVAQPLGFDQLISDSQQATQQNLNSNQTFYQNSSVNTFSGYFGGSSAVEEAAPPAAQPQPLTGCITANFFDNFASGGQVQEDQRIQNFFNNPPLQEQPAAPGELKYDIVHSGLPKKQFEERSQTSVSNLVEPPSSVCSEFSTATPLNTSSTAAASPESQLEYLQQVYQGQVPEELIQQLKMATEKGTTPPVEAVVYSPALLHWFYKRVVDSKFLWTPFSHYDSALLETSLNSDDADSSAIVAVEGGRYDVNIKERTKTPVFWEGKAIEVRRCSWFYKAPDSKYVPYAEETAVVLEAEYKVATETGEWHKKIALANGEQVTMHGPTVMVHFMPPANADTWGGTVQSSTRPLVVKRDLNDFKILPGESQRVDHLLFMVHGIGSACDLKMRNVEEVVDDFRFIAQQLVQSHYKNSTDMGLVGRVEVLPIEWHGHLHSEELGIDEKLKSITLESIPRLRHFTNDTLLDVLFYTSPKYCQKIMNTVADALNEVYLKYRMRHPEFNGGVSLAGHSLGSLILFDLLCHQESLKESDEENKENPDQLPQKHGHETAKHVQLPNNDQMLPKQVSYAMGMGIAGTGQPVINYTQLIFHPKKFFALGSPIGMFVTIRGIDKLGLDFRLPTCPGFYNIFHPFDPVAYRIEALVNPDMKGIRPVLIPHHKGRKRMHLELKETMTRVGADIKQRFMDTFKTTLDSVNFLATVTKVKKDAEQLMEKETNTSSTQVFQKSNEDQEETSLASTSTHARQRTDSESTLNSDPEFIELDFPLGKLNDSKRVDYVLQEAPLEFINEYIFALSSHVCYWGSEDTILFVMKEIYAGLGITTDSQVPQQTMTIERPSSRTNSLSQSLLPM